MDSRRRLVSLVMEDGLSIAAASRECHVSRQTGHLWVGRAKTDGLLGMKENSRRPKNSPTATSPEIVEKVLSTFDMFPMWGAAILHAFLWPDGNAPICERTVGRILERGSRRVLGPKKQKADFIRFERAESNELWQVDFKKVGHFQERKESLSILDDATRFCIDLRVTPNQTLVSVWDVLWEAFGEFGLPKSVLSDNGPAFRCNATWRWSSFDLQLMLLGIKPIHGRPYHPQTQGKVERLHGTMEREILFERGTQIQATLDQFRDRYNWLRPHQANDKRTPGSVYKPSSTTRPDKMPEPFFAEGTIVRKCNDTGIFQYQGRLYKAGRAFEHKHIGIVRNENDVLTLVWGGFNLAPLNDLLF